MPPPEPRRRTGYDCLVGIRVAVFLAAAAAAMAQRPPGRPQFSPEAVERGRAQFAQSCAFCHGANANGATHGPSLIRSTVARHDESGELIGAVVREGRPSQGMPPVPLTPAQLSDVVTFLKSRIAAADIRSANRPMGGSTDRLLVGRADAGKAFFNSAGGCSACHSPTGDLAGIGRKYPPDVLQARLLYPQQKQITATVTDSAGARFAGTLLALTLYDVAIQDSAGWYHSWPVASVKVEVEDKLAAHRDLLPKCTDSDMHNLLSYLETLK
jgi:cytochrome c oxidase cbb3-type subunit 3